MISAIVDDVVIIDICEAEEKLNDVVDLISKNTYNTWQINRGFDECKHDTMIGKIGENSFEQALAILGVLYYHSYDEIRDDDFKNHAPFDGFFCETFDESISEFINSFVHKEGTKLSNSTKNQLRKRGILTVEVKSTQLADSYKERCGFTSYGSSTDITNLVNLLKNYDYFKYPTYKRKGDLDFKSYCAFVKDKLKLTQEGDELYKYVANLEKELADDVYVRVFVDLKCKKCLIMGWIDNGRLLENPEIKKFYKSNKSENTMYLAKKIMNGYRLNEFNKHLVSHFRKLKSQ